MKILVATEKPFAPVAVSMIRDVSEQAGHQVYLLENYRSKTELLAAVADADALIVRSDNVTAEVLDAAPKLKIVVRAGAGYDNIDIKACTARNIVAMNTPGQNSNAVAELAFLMMLYHARSGFSGSSGTELRGKSLGLHAFGFVGKCMAEIARGFSMKIFSYDPFVNEDVMLSAGVTPVRTAEELYGSCRYVSIHIPATDQTKKSIGFSLINLLPENGVLVNTARKEVIDEEGLIMAFLKRDDISYLADVEPDCRAVFEEKFKGRYIFTAKKMGAQTEEANTNAGIAAAKQIVDFFLTGNTKYKVN
mgnify:CR=1 FL=1